jgi:uncharacterized protein (DUF302 family)
MATLGMRRELGAPYHEVLARLPDLLKAEGFGVVSEIDVTATLKQKIGVDFRRYRILGACNPRIAHEVLQRVPDAGVLLPCNVAVYEEGEGTVVTAVDPLQTLAALRPDLGDLVADARGRLARVLEKL